MFAHYAASSFNAPEFARVLSCPAETPSPTRLSPSGVNDHRPIAASEPEPRSLVARFDSGRQFRYHASHGWS
jgi:hypothetical protein